MALQYLEALKQLGATAATKYVIPLELTDLARRLGNFLDSGLEIRPGRASRQGPDVAGERAATERAVAPRPNLPRPLPTRPERSLHPSLPSRRAQDSVAPPCQGGTP